MIFSLLAAVLAVSPPTASLAGTREDHDGWIVLHLIGTPKEIGYEHGSMLAKEIDDSVQTVQIELRQTTGKDWSWYKQTTHKLFWNKLDPEYQEEISAIADGAKSKGVELDADDILALNGYIEVSGYYLPVEQAKEKHEDIKSKAPLACSAFVATGAYTVGGKVVMAHNFWWDYPMGERWNVVFDIQPAKGHHFMMDALPGLIESGSDWAVNDAGISFCETTISGFTGFDENGLPEFMRMRKAIQYSESLEDVARIFKTGNNGGYANTWLMADANNNEIGKLELGLKNVTYVTTKDGYYVGANFPENPKLLAEEAKGYRPEGCEDRKQRWIQDMKANKGHIDAEMAKKFLEDTYDDGTKKNDGLGGGALCSKSPFGGAVNAKVLTGDMVHEMKFWARMGCPDGTDIKGAEGTYGGHFHDLKGNPWTVLAGK